MDYINNRTVHDRRYAAGLLSAILADAVMAQMTAGELERCTGGMLAEGSRDTLISGISIDTRTLNPGDLFFAIRGTKTDGHRYVPAALSGGASGAVVDFSFEPGGCPPDKILLRVEDTHKALKDLAYFVRRSWKGSLVAITGSMGKTTTKEFAAQVLQTEFSVYRSPGNYNNLFGLPLAVFGLSPDDHIGIFEMGMSAPGEIAEMCRIAAPTVGIITNVAPVHLAFFASLEDIARAKAELADALPSDGTLIYNTDDPRVREIGRRFGGATVSFGQSRDAEVRASEIEVAGLQETRFQLTCGGVARRAMIPLGGAHFVMNALPAVALANRYHLALDQIVESLRFLSQAPMRGQILRLRTGFAVIDDSYNSNPQALMRVLEAFATVPGYRRRIVVAGEMLELGSTSEDLHYECGRHAAECGADVVVAVQGAARKLAMGAADGGVPAGNVHFFDEVGPAVSFVMGIVREGDLLLVKGSRAVGLDRLVRALAAGDSEQVH